MPVRLWAATFVIVALGVWQLRLSLDEERCLAFNAAFVWVIATLYWRFVDSVIPLWLKGVVFIATGLALFAPNRFMAKRHKGAAP